jgi:hypothetical protein
VSREIDLAIGPGGWVKAHAQRLGSAWIRFERDPENRWVPVVFWLPNPTIERLRAFPLHRVEVAVNASESVDRELSNRLDEDYDIGLDFFEKFTGFTKPAGPVPRITLKRPEGRRLDDSFYAKVADAYRAAAARGMKPRTAIAKAADVSTDVAGRWVHEARKRGYLPPGEQGRVTVHKTE